MQLTTAIYCFNFFSGFTRPTTSCRFEPCDVYIGNYVLKSHNYYVNLNQSWTGSPFEVPA